MFLWTFRWINSEECLEGVEVTDSSSLSTSSPMWEVQNHTPYDGVWEDLMSQSEMEDQIKLIFTLNPLISLTVKECDELPEIKREGN